MTARYLLAWFGLAVLAVINGIIREASYGKVLSELAAHQLSTVSGIAITGVFVYFLSRIWPLESSAQAWLIGFAWLLFTIAFEFGFGHFVAGHPLSRLVSDYNLLNGRVWTLFLLWVLVMPVLFYKLAR